MNKKCYILLILVLTITYFACFNDSFKGAGYPGHKGYHRGHHSFWYFGGHNYSYNPSVRENSVYGSGFSRKGISGGK